MLFKSAIGNKKRGKNKFPFFNHNFNRKDSNSSPVTTSHSYLLHLHSALFSTTGNAAKIAWNALLFGGKDSTPDPELKAAQRQVLIYAFFSLKETNPSIEWNPYQPPSTTPPITAFLTIARTENGNLLLRLISCLQSDRKDPAPPSTFR